MDTLLNVLYWYMILSGITMLLTALYFAAYDIICWFKWFGYKPDSKFGYAYNPKFPYVIAFVLLGLPFVNIFFVYMWIDSAIQMKKEKAKRETQKVK